MNNLSSKQHKKIGRWMIYASWVLIFALLIWFFGIIETNKRNPNQRVQTNVTDSGKKEVILRSSTHGHYLVTGKINNKKAIFMIDTGASYVSIPGHIASKLELKKGAPMRVTTANGEITVYATMLDEVSVCEITLYDIKADINPHMQNDEILLGMSFLRHLSITHKGDQLTIRK